MTKRSDGMLTCEEVMARLWEYIDGELPPADSQAVQRHLELCGRCYPTYDFQHAYLAFVRLVRDREGAPAALRRRIFTRLLQQESSRGIP